MFAHTIHQVSNDGPAARVCMLVEDGSPRAFQLMRDRILTIGRDQTNDIVLLDPRCSRQHAEIYHNGQCWVLCDLGSLNGTLVNQTRVDREWTLAPHDLIQIGGASLKFLADDSEFRLQSVLEPDTGDAGRTDDSHAESTILVQRQRHPSFINEASICLAWDRSKIALLFEMAHATDMEELAQLMLAGLLGTTQATHGAIFSLPDSAAVEPSTCRIHAATRDYRLITDYLLKTLLSGKQAMLAHEVNDDSQLCRRDELGKVPGTSVICAPIRCGNRIFGLVHIYGCDSSQLLTPGDLDFTVSVADMFAVAVQKLAGVQTARRQLESAEAMLRQSQKMEAIGQLAGGIAHDFNNLLTVILGYSSLMLTVLPPGDFLYEPAAEIQHASERAAALTRQLLAFSRKQVLETKTLDLNDIVRNMEKILRRLIGEHIVVTSILAPDLRLVNVDLGQIEQVVMNLAVNARDAMPQGGALTLQTRNVEAADGPLTAGDGTPRSCISLALTDTGVGMTLETKARVFEPFFTTKGQGKGTGLGLATVFGIVQQSCGAIAVESRLGAGTTFTIYLPAVEGTEQAPQGKVIARRPDGGVESVLLVEDDEPVRKIARIALETQGYRVLEACGGGQALALLEAREDPVQILITDNIMPGMNGRELAEAVRACRPGIKVLFMSGYLDDLVLLSGLSESRDGFLQKPYSPDSLVKKVRELLDG